MDGLGGVRGLSEGGATTGSQPECCHGEMQAQYPQDLQLWKRGWKLKYLCELSRSARVNQANLAIGQTGLGAAKAQSHLTLCDPMHCSPQGSSVHGIPQARILEWVAISSPRDLPDTGIKPGSPTLEADALTSEPPGKP